jgi:hypothetical protein
MVWQWLCGILLLVAACSPHSSSEFQQEGQALCEDLTQVLQSISSREELLGKEDVLKKKFESLVTLIVEARKAQQSEELAEEEGTPYSFQIASHALKAELQRLYELEGGREIIERSQQEALVRLDGQERTLQKMRARVPEMHSRR